MTVNLHGSRQAAPGRHAAEARHGSRGAAARAATKTSGKQSKAAERAALYFAITVLVLVICVVKLQTAMELDDAVMWGTYGIVVTAYILSRFGLAFFYRPRQGATRLTSFPTVAIVVPAYNEPDEITGTLDACLGVEYPSDKLTVVVVDDKSTDSTLEVIHGYQAAHPELRVIAQPVNRGKRQAMAAGMTEIGDAEFVVFIDSDSIVSPSAVETIVKYFMDPDVGAVAGHTDVANADTNFLTRMQSVRYFVAFRVYKSSEALFNSVTCCSGCFSAYRRTALDEVLDPWLAQTFLGQESTYGDDRSLTNYLLRHWKVLYAPDAQAYTTVPDSMTKFLKQQLRWKKSWIRESMRAMSIMWRKNPIMSIGFYIGVILPLLAPFVVFRSLVVQPVFTGGTPIWYLGGVLAMAMLYGLYFRVYRRERYWYHGVFFALFYTGVLVWQFPYAIATLRDSKWGTR